LDVVPGNVNDLAAANESVLPVLGDTGYEGTGHGILVPVKKHRWIRQLDVKARARNALIRSIRCLGERGFALLNQCWQTLQHITASRGKTGQIADVALTLFEHKTLT
jgi:hypothetical protein